MLNINPPASDALGCRMRENTETVLRKIMFLEKYQNYYLSTRVKSMLGVIMVIAIISRWWTMGDNYDVVWTSG